MKTDPATALHLIERILADESETFSQEEIDCLFENKEACVRKLLPILALEITQIKEGDLWNSDKLLGSIKLLAVFEEKKAFDWIIQLHEFPDALDDAEGHFIVLFWADILVATLSSEWHKLQETIENPEAHGAIREACIDAIVSLVGKDELDRDEAIQYIQSLYSQILEGHIQEPELIIPLLEASISLWPGESLEEIREIFGIGLVDEEFLSLSEVLKAYESGKEECLSELKNWSEPSLLIDFFIDEPSSEETHFDSSFEYEREESDEFNEYNLQEEESELYEFIGNYTPPLLPCKELETLPQKKQKKYNALPKLLTENAEEALETASELVADHPQIPAFLYYLHEALLTLDAQFYAMAIVKKWVELFPNDLLGKIEYAHYFLRRGEPEKASHLFSGTWSLAALYPETLSFHETECLRFLHLVGCYFLQIGEIEKAKEQVQILDATNPNSFEYHHLKRKISLYLEEDFFVED